MKFYNFIPVLFMFSVGSAVAAIPDLGAVSKVEAGRVGDNIVRYVKTFNDSCLEVQVLSPENGWKILAAKSFCSFENKKFESDFADAGFEDISVKEDGIHLILSITPLQPTGEQRRNCIIPIASTTIKNLNCSQANK